MKIPIIIYVLIILLAGIGIVLVKLKFGSADNVKWTDVMQVILTAALVIVTGINVYLVRQTIDEMAKSRISQEEWSKKAIESSQKMQEEQIKKTTESSLKVIEEMKLARKQQLRPYIYVHFHWDNNLNKFFSILRNLGGGIATDIEYRYPFGQETIKYRYQVLAPGEEVIDNTPFSLEHINQKDPIKVTITYKDTFGNIIKEEQDENLRELANYPLPSKFTGRRQEQIFTLKQEDAVEKISLKLNELVAEIKKINETLKHEKN